MAALSYPPNVIRDVMSRLDVDEGGLFYTILPDGRLGRRRRRTSNR